MTDILIIGALIGGIIILLLYGTTTKYVKIIKRLGVNFLVGVILLIIINFIGNKLGYHIAINELTVVTVGVLGVPGLVAIVIIKDIV